MRESFVRKIAALMCAVMLFCSIPLNVSVLAANGDNTETTAAQGSSSAAEGTEAEQGKDITEVLKEIIEAVKKFVVAVADYLEEQEKLKQEQENGEQAETPPSTETDSDLSKNGIAGYLYDPKEKCFYTASDPWQRIVGYNEIFDIFSEVALIDFDTVRFKFNYKNENWMIQIWKGQYGLLFYGAEIGVYNKPMDRAFAHYDAVEDHERLKMSMDFYEYEKKLLSKAEWNKKFSRPYEYYWWCTGFIPGNRDNKFDRLRVDARITATDYDMLSALTKAIKKEGVTYKVKGLDIMLSYQ